MEVLFFVITIFISLVVEVAIGIRFNLAGIGAFVEIAFAAAVILYAIRHKNKSRGDIPPSIYFCV